MCSKAAQQLKMLQNQLFDQMPEDERLISNSEAFLKQSCVRSES